MIDDETEQIALNEICKELFPHWKKQWDHRRVLQMFEDETKLRQEIKDMSEQLDQIKRGVAIVGAKMTWLNMTMTYSAGGLPMFTHWKTIPGKKAVERIRRKSDV